VTYKLQKIDELTLADHYEIDRTDNCFFICEYTSNVGYGYSDANQLISNLKKSVLKIGTSAYTHKIHAMLTVARLIASFKGIENYTIVPIPPSKIQEHREYDDRLLKILADAKQINPNVQFCDLIHQKSSTRASHASTGNRLSKQELVNNFNSNGENRSPISGNVLIFDDLLTNGTHYKAAQQYLIENFPNIRVSGLFIARRIFKNPFEDTTEDEGINFF
jgi:hypothetical protein